MTERPRYVDATDSSDLRVDYPDVIAQLESLGFARIGRIAFDLDQTAAEGIGAQYTPEDRDDFMAHWDIPMPVLASRDGMAFADVSWWWGGPSVRIRSELSDGSLVETRRKWDRKPGLPKSLRFLWRRFDIDREMTRAAVPLRGRSIEIRTGSDTGALWRAHHDHVNRYSKSRNAVVVEHRDLETYMRIATQAFGHDWKVTSLVSKLWIRLILAWGILVVGLSLGLALTGATAIALNIAIASVVLTPAVVYVVMSRFRWLPQSWRPNYP